MSSRFSGYFVTHFIFIFFLVWLFLCLICCSNFLLRSFLSSPVLLVQLCFFTRHISYLTAQFLRREFAVNFSSSFDHILSIDYSWLFGFQVFQILEQKSANRWLPPRCRIPNIQSHLTSQSVTICALTPLFLPLCLSFSVSVIVL